MPASPTIPALPPSSEQMLSAAARWKRGARRTSRYRWRPFVALVKRLHGEEWTAKEIADRVLAEGWITTADWRAFHRWVCRQMETLDAGGEIL